MLIGGYLTLPTVGSFLEDAMYTSLTAIIISITCLYPLGNLCYNSLNIPSLSYLPFLASSPQKDISQLCRTGGGNAVRDFWEKLESRLMICYVCCFLSLCYSDQIVCFVSLGPGMQITKQSQAINGDALSLFPLTQYLKTDTW